MNKIKIDEASQFLIKLIKNDETGGILITENEVYIGKNWYRRTSEAFYHRILDNPFVMTPSDFYSECDKEYSYGKKPPIYSIDIFQKNYREGFPLLFILKSGICFSNYGTIFFIKQDNDYKKYSWFWNPNKHSEMFDRLKHNWTTLRIDKDFDMFQFEENKLTFICKDDSKFHGETWVMNMAKEEIVIIKDFIKFIEIEKGKAIEHEKQKIKLELSNFSDMKSQLLQELDMNNDGIIDLIENDFNKILMNNQSKIIEFDKNYIHQFVKVSNYIKNKKYNLETQFESIKLTKKEGDIEYQINLLKNQKHTYESLIFHSINMVTALMNQDLITFYEIYESFDSIGIYKSNWENEVTIKLSNIGEKLDNLMSSIYDLENKITEQFSKLTYVTQESFQELNLNVLKQLDTIDSTIKFNNLLSAVQTYQLYKINKQTKPLLPKN